MSEFTIKDPNICLSFEKTGSCPKGDQCTKSHKIPTICRCLVFHHLYPDPRLFCKMVPSGVIEIGDDENQHLIDAFFLDIVVQLNIYGPLDDLLICSNLVDHLCGNVIAIYKEADAAMMAYQHLRNKYYAGRKISVTFAPIQRVSTTVCREFATGQCTNGNKCQFIHPAEPSYFIYNECFPRCFKSYPDIFRKGREKRIVDNPNEILGGKTRKKLDPEAYNPETFPKVPLDFYKSTS